MERLVPHSMVWSWARSEEHTSELQSANISYAVFCLKKKTAGLWQATWRVSEIYLGIVMASLALYFPARLGEVVGTPKLREEIVRTLARGVDITADVALTIFLLRDWVVRIVFTEEFLPMRDLMPFQLLGDMLTV